MKTTPFKVASVLFSFVFLSGCADTRKLSSLQSEFNQTVRQERECRNDRDLEDLNENLDCAEDFDAIFLGIAEESKKTIGKRDQKDAIKVGLYNIAALALWQGGAKVGDVAGLAAEGYDLCAIGDIKKQTPRNCALLRAAGWLAAADQGLPKIKALRTEFTAIKSAGEINSACQAKLVQKTDGGKSKQEELSSLIIDYGKNVFGDSEKWLDRAEKIEGLDPSVANFFSAQRKKARNGTRVLLLTAQTCFEPSLLKTDKACECADGRMTADQCGVTQDNPLAIEIFMAKCLDDEAKKRAGIGG